MVERLYRARGVAWAALVPAFDHAIALAREDEYRAARASDEVQAGIAPSYSPMVELLAASAPPAPDPCPDEWDTDDD
jgi:hypothetical protein